MNMKKEVLFQDLIILELANNHMGDVKHGKDLIRAFGAVAKDFPAFRFVFKFQYRDLDTFIHPDYQGRMDIKYIKRFSETRLSEEQFLELKKTVEEEGFLSMCTPFDEVSVDRVVRHKFDFLKIASCSFNDWPLLEKAVKADLPIVISTAGAELQDIDKVVTFLEHREIRFCLMHCVGSYPTPDHELELNQIDFFKKRYPDIPVGFSTHERPDNFLPAMLATAKGAVILERHVGLPTEKYPLNAYSSSPDQIRAWLAAIVEARAMCGGIGQRREISVKEAKDLRGLQRGAFLRKAVKASELIHQDNLFYAIPCQEDQFRANDISKYLTLTAKCDLPANAALEKSKIDSRNISDKVLKIIRDLCSLIKKANLPLQDKLEFEISHHYGIDRFYEAGCAIITCINREYCKKIILVLPGQRNPTHTHIKKEETFHVLYGTAILTLNGARKTFNAGDLIVIERGVAHDFASETGTVLEEISTTHFKNDSIYDDSSIAPAEQRKTYMTFYNDWITKGV